MKYLLCLSILFISLTTWAEDPFQEIWNDTTANFWLGEDEFIALVKQGVEIPTHININNWVEQTNYPTVHFLSYHERVKSLQILVDKGFDLDMTNAEGETSLVVAVTSGYPHSAKFLIDNGADVFATNAQGQNIVDIAWNLPEKDYVDVDHGVDLYYVATREYIIGEVMDKYNLPKPNMEKIYTMTFDPKKKNTVENYQAIMLQNKIKLPHVFTKNDFTNESFYNYSSTPAELFDEEISANTDISRAFLTHPITDFGPNDIKMHNDFIQLLVTMGASTDYIDGTYLMPLIRTPQTNLIPFFLSRGVDINAQDINGNTALHHAISSLWALTNYMYYVEMHLKVLLESGANPNILNRAGKTPLNILMEEGCDYTELKELLLKYGADPDLGIIEKKEDAPCVG